MPAVRYCLPRRAYDIVLRSMPRDPVERISMTIPPEILRRADRLAKAWDRSRSWVLAEGVRLLPDPPRPAASRLDDFRRHQLDADLALSVDERVIAAERTAREVPARALGRLFVSFERFEDYFEWKRLEATGRL